MRAQWVKQLKLYNSIFPRYLHILTVINTEDIYRSLLKSVGCEHQMFSPSRCVWCSSFLLFWSTVLFSTFRTILTAQCHSDFIHCFNFAHLITTPSPIPLVCFHYKLTGSSGCARKPAACSGFQSLLKLPFSCQQTNGCFMFMCTL